MSSITLPYGEPHSHPPEGGDPSSGVLLTDHLRDVGQRAGQLAKRGADTRVYEVTRICGELHDFGKVTPFFQFHIAGETPTPESLKNHSPLGAIAAYHVLSEIGYDEETALIGLIAIAKHHGVLPDVIKYVNDTALGTERSELLTDQLKGIEVATAETADAILGRASGRTTDWTTFHESHTSGELQAAIKDQITARKGQLKQSACSTSFYDRIMQIWGALIIADKTSAAGIGTETFSATHKHSRAVTEHIDELQREAARKGISPEREELNRMRDQARQSIVKNGRAIARAASGDGWLGEITLPTGLGKTLAVLHLGHAIGEERGEPARIIYALPYTSIIDQTATVIEDVFDVDKTTDELTIHHHLEEVVTTIEEYAQRRKKMGFDPDEYAREEYLAAKGWNSGMTLTTFVQLFESLVRPSNQQAMKLPALYNSVIILDEPQALPLDWWRLIRRLVRTLVEDFDATVISMTATQPKILTASTCEFDVHQLVDDPDQYFELVERVEYQYDHSLEDYLIDPEDAEGRTHESAAETIVANIMDEEPTGLAICNTVASAVTLTDEIDGAAGAAGYDLIALGEVYEPLAKRDDETFDTTDCTITEARAQELRESLDTAVEGEGVSRPLVTLHQTTRHRPTDRKVLLEAASALAEDREVPFVFVATQLVEAGVDISMTRVYRDFGPISSIVQAAGRCNRSAERDRGVVTIWRLEKAGGADLPPSTLVYGIGENSKLEPTARALRSVAPARSASAGPRTVREMAVAREGVEQYYEILDRERDVGTQEYVDWVDTAKFEKLRELSLIDERPAFDVLVCRSDEEQARAEALMRAVGAGSIGDAHEVLSTLEGVQVSLPESAVLEGAPRGSTPVEVGSRVVWVIEQGEGNYSPRTGLRE